MIWRRIALAAATMLLVGAVGVALVAGLSRRGHPYLVRAVFDNAGNVTTGEDVKVAGVKVGSVASLDVTAQDKAVVVLRITAPGFADFRADASCTVRPQSLIGEKFVECSPTQPRPAGAPLPPRLRTLRGGEHLLPLAQTSSPVDLDLIGDVMRLPYRQRLTLIINELGGGLAGQAGDLRASVLRADPALAQADRVLAVLAEENRTLAQLAQDSDRVLVPLAGQRAHVAHSLGSIATVARASAEHAAGLRADLARLPAFLEQLGPTMDQLSGLADQATPLLSSLRAAAPGTNRSFVHLPPFAQSSTVFLRSLASAARATSAPISASLPLARRLAGLGSSADPFAQQTAALLSSFRDAGGIERLMDFVFLSASSFNGYDSLGHFLRSALVANPCSTYATSPVAGCSANFVRSTPSAGAASAASTRTTSLLGYLLGR